MAEVWQFFAHEDDYPDLDEQALCERLAAELAIPTVDGPSREETNWAAFDQLEDYFRGCFPLLFAAATVEKIDHSLMLTVPGRKPELCPALLLGHMDVVPVVPGTEGDWTHGAFSGYVDDEYVWGRGALDMSDQVMGMLEAVEYLLAHDGGMDRTAIICLGQDEETLQSGARAMGQELLRRGVRAEFAIDEGDYLVADLSMFGGTARRGLMVFLSEKGYADVRLTVRSAGGHSSNPFGGTSLAVLSEAIARLNRADWGCEMTDLFRATLEAAGADASVDPHDLLADPELYPYVTTTCAPTMIEGGSAQANVMPQDMTAVVNFRLLMGTTVADVVARVEELLADLPVEVELVREVSNDPSAISRFEGPGADALRAACARYFRDPETGDALPLVPSFLLGASDSRMYECVCDSCLRFSPFVADADEVSRGVHGTDERITRRAYLQGIRFLITLLRA
jgi:carboxypeptidase PM20D1